MNSYPAVIFAGGRGSRLRPVTDAVHKSLISVNKIPIILYALESLRRAGAKELYFALGYLSRQIEEFLRANNNFGFEVSFNDRSSCCPFHALKSLEPYIDRPFALIHSDIIISCHTFEELVKLFEGDVHLCVVGLSPFHLISTHPYSTILGTRITQIWLKKPRRTKTRHLRRLFCWNGTYLFDNEFFNYLDRYSEAKPSYHGIPEAALVGEAVRFGEVRGLVSPDKWFHLGFKKDLIQAGRGLRLEIMKCYETVLDASRINLPSKNNDSLR